MAEAEADALLTPTRVKVHTGAGRSAIIGADGVLARNKAVVSKCLTLMARGARGRTSLECTIVQRLKTAPLVQAAGLEAPSNRRPALDPVVEAQMMP